MIDSRKGHRLRTATGTRSSELPLDYVRMVEEVFATHFDEALQTLRKLGHEASFRCDGAVLPDEVLLGVSLTVKGQLAATTLCASVDFDPKASSPSAQDLLAACVDATASLFAQLLDPKDPAKLERVVGETLSALENVPFQWAGVEVNRRTIHLKMDKSNPDLDRQADDWLAKNDPDTGLAAEREQAENLFVTGPRGKKPTRH